MTENGHDHPHAEPRHERSPWAARIRAVEELLVEKGVFTAEEVEAQIEYMEARSYENGARLVARAWVDPAFKERLLADTKAAAAELGMDTSGTVEFATVENTDEVHNVIVCTLCSCYPRAILGRPPDWYKSLAYRSRVVAEPREVLRGAARVRAGCAGGQRYSRPRQLGRPPLPSPPATPGRDRGNGRRSFGRARHAG